MKNKLLIILLCCLSSCGLTSINQDIQNLQKQYKTVYKISSTQYVVVDSTDKIFHLDLRLNGEVKTKIQIK